MTPEAQRIALSHIHFGEDNYQVKLIGCPRPEHYRWEKDGTWVSTPDYLNDLNAIRSVEEKLNRDQQWQYIDHLAYITGTEWTDSYEEVFVIRHATAAQCAKALLKTHGKWTD